LWDLPESGEIQAITQTIYEQGGMVAAVGHGVAGLLQVKLSNGDLLIKEKYLTAFSNVEETLASFVSETPFFLEDKLKEAGAVFTKSILPFVQYIEVDERLITGQNPTSSRKVAQKVLEEISEK
jgi:putative intracellular protease/amidase